MAVCSLYQWTCTGGSVLSMQEADPQIHRFGKLPVAGRLLLKSIGPERWTTEPCGKPPSAVPAKDVAATAVGMVRKVRRFMPCPSRQNARGASMFGTPSGHTCVR